MSPLTTTKLVESRFCEWAANPSEIARLEALLARPAASNENSRDWGAEPDCVHWFGDSYADSDSARER